MTAIPSVSVSNAIVESESYSLERDRDIRNPDQRVKIQFSGYNPILGLTISIEGTTSDLSPLDDLLDRSSEDTFTITIEKN